MNNTLARISNFVVLSVLLPVFYGCNSGGDSSSGGGGIQSLLSDSDGAPIATLSTPSIPSGPGSVPSIPGDLPPEAFIGGGDTIATISNPEPATMMLIGGGLAALGYYRAKANRS